MLDFDLFLKIGFRIITIMIVFLFSTIISGRRHVSELPVFDFLIIITLGSVVGADITEPDVSHSALIFSVILIIFLQYLYGLVIIKSRKLGKLMTFGPTIVIENGEFVINNMDRIKYSIDIILTMLREKDIFDVTEVEYGIIESTGKLSVIKKLEYMEAMKKDLNIVQENIGIKIPVVIEGRIYDENLKQLNLDINWLNDELNNNNIQDAKSVFYASVDSISKKISISKGVQNSSLTYSIRH